MPARAPPGQMQTESRAPAPSLLQPGPRGAVGLETLRVHLNKRLTLAGTEGSLRVRSHPADTPDLLRFGGRMEPLVMKQSPDVPPQGPGPFPCETGLVAHGLASSPRAERCPVDTQPLLQAEAEGDQTRDPKGTDLYWYLQQKGSARPRSRWHCYGQYNTGPAPAERCLRAAFLEYT